MKPEHRLAADRTDHRYPSDLSDAEWLIVEPIAPAKRGGRLRSVNVREMSNLRFCPHAGSSRTFARISCNRRLARDFERYATTVAAFVRLAMIRIMLRRLAASLSS